MHRSTNDVTHLFLSSNIYANIFESFIIFNIATAFQMLNRLYKYIFIVPYLCTISSLDHYLRNLCLVTSLEFISVSWFVMTMGCL